MFNIFVQGVEGQEAGSVGQVEEGHGEGGGRQQVVAQHLQHLVGLACYVKKLYRKGWPALYMVPVSLSNGRQTFKYKMKQHHK